MPASPRLVQLVVFDGFQLLDLSGPADVFNAAAVLSGKPLYDLEIVAARPGPIRAFSGLEVTATRTLGDTAATADTLIVTGGLTFDPARSDTALVEGIRDSARRTRRIGSVCTGAFLLAEAGLLAGRRATTHWAGGAVLGELYPDIRVEPDRIYVRDGEIWTSAGVTAGIDLAIAMVADDHGTDLAREISRWLVVYLHRPGGQSQFSAPVAAGPPRRTPMRALQIWIEENLACDLTVEALARQSGMSTRNFSRVFAAEFGSTPARYVERARVAAARRLLETSDYTLDRVAAEVGLGRPETLYRTFQRQLGVAPGEYRQRFARRWPDLQ
ncbi:GlxA family transcriptional regulator [Nocardia pseudobrasiliensis]|uniref:Transcriptional regulator GlxA family with amidase domain n=1 Tax=Nocardia pseudobrasiliensis TaxID=45979 RepID=A0A370I9J6_9NOCA|nr:GlxA family transcriptional regulator [Nocardia pseudobrasiliensis]RDI67387.1 transcriptional regulator GlxA family with amidase domain [Nocardia pseudobrasiliensis]